MNRCRNSFNISTHQEGPTDRQYEDLLLQALSPDYQSIGRAHLERWNFGLANVQRIMVAIYADNLSRRIITSVGIPEHGVTTKAMDLLTEVQYHNCAMFGHYRIYSPNRRKQQYQRRKHQQQPNGRQRTRGRQLIRMEVAEEVSRVHITKPPPIVTLTAAHNTSKTTTMPT